MVYDIVITALVTVVGVIWLWACREHRARPRSYADTWPDWTPNLTCIRYRERGIEGCHSCPILNRCPVRGDK